MHNCLTKPSAKLSSDLTEQLSIDILVLIYCVLQFYIWFVQVVLP